MRRTAAILQLALALGWVLALPSPADEEKALVIEPVGAALPDTHGNWAVVAGVDLFQDENVSPLAYAVADAKSIFEELTSPGGLVPPEQGYLLVTDGREKPTRENVLSAIKFMVDHAPEDGLVIVYLSSHGFIDDQKRSYVMPENGMKNLLEDTALSVARIQEFLSPGRCRANKRLLVVDACRNAPLQSARGGTEEVSSRFHEELSKAQGEVIMVSCGPGEVSYEDEEMGHGVFTYFFLEGLRGQAPRDERGMVTVATLGDFLSEEITSWCKRKRKTPFQNPWMESKSTRSIPLSCPDTKPAGVTPPPPVPPPLPTPAAPPQPFQTETDQLSNEVGLEMVFLPGGTFAMGQDAGLETLVKETLPSASQEETRNLVFKDEVPQHPESAQGFWMGRHEVTQAQWQEVAVNFPMVHIQLNPDPAKTKGPTLPVENVSLSECREFCTRLSVRFGKVYRLPTESEWECAARAGGQELFAWGNDILQAKEYENCADSDFFASEGDTGKAADGSLSPGWSDGYSHTAPVGTYKPNGFQLYDMGGNVAEWCEASDGDRTGAAKGFNVFRGGSWGHGPLALRPSFRTLASPKTPPSGFVGFRVSRSQ